MKANLQERLARLKHYATRYEVVATRGTHRILAGYTSRKSREGLLGMIRQHGQAWVGFCQSEDFHCEKGIITIAEWNFSFSGRTQRESIIAGELPFILEINPADYRTLIAA